MKFLSSVYDFFFLLRYCVKKNYNVFTFFVKSTTFEEIEAVIEKLQLFRFVINFRKNLDSSVSIFLSLDSEALLCLRSVVIVSKNRGVISYKLVKNFVKEHPSALIFVRTTRGILTSKEIIKYKCGGQMVALVK